MIYLQLFFEFFKAGLFAFGGGMTLIPFLYNISDTLNWFSHEQVADMIAVSQAAPGPIGINMATYVGYALKGIPGSLVAVFGLIAPSVIIILIVAKFLKAYNENKIVKSAFYGLRPAATGLIASAGFTIIAVSLLNIDLFNQTGFFLDVFNLKAVLLALVMLAISIKFKKINPVYLIIISAIIGIVFKF